MSDPRDPDTWNQTTPSGIPYRLMNHTGALSFDKINATEEYLVPTSRVEDFIKEFFPLPVLQNGIWVYKYRPMPGRLKITASNVTWKSHDEGLPIDPFEGHPQNSPDAYCPRTVVTATFDDQADDISDSSEDENDPTTFLEISASASGEFIHAPVPQSAWQSSGTGTEPNTNPHVPAQIIVPETEWTMTWPLVNGVYFSQTLISRLRDIIGKVNEDVYPLLYDAPAETLLFVGWDMSEERQFLFESDVGNTSFSRKPLRVSMKVLEKRAPIIGGGIAGHNHVWRPGIGWQRLLINGTDPLYQSHDYDELFAVE